MDKLQLLGIGMGVFAAGALAAVSLCYMCGAAPGVPLGKAGSDSEEVRKLQEHLAAERTGRVRAEKTLRESVNKRVVSGDGFGYPLLPIGHIASPFRGRWGTPRQGMLTPDARAHIVFNPAIPATALQGLAEYSHVFVLFLFHENSNLHKLAKVPPRAEGLPDLTRAQRAAERRKGGAGGGEEGGEDGGEDSTLTRLLRERHFSALIEAPALKGHKTGVLSTRSPHRPNAIGLSLCRLVAVHDSDSSARMLVLSGCDLIEGTPIIDVKPYAPYDCPVCLGELVGVHQKQQEPTSAAAPSASAAAAAAPFEAARDLSAAVRNLGAGTDLTCPSSYALRGPAWVYGTLQDPAKARLPVVWGPGTAEFMLDAVRQGKTRFYGAREAALHGSTRKNGLAAAPALATPLLLEAEGRALLQAVSQVLALDIRAVHHGRGGAPSETRGGAALRSAGSPSQLRRMGPAAAAAGAEGGGAAAPEQAADVQYYELWFDVFDLKWTCVESAKGEGEVWGAAASGDKRWFARVDTVAFANSDLNRSTEPM
jgi:tRNA (Thr-GGU) A37 N-methylase